MRKVIVVEDSIAASVFAQAVLVDPESAAPLCPHGAAPTTEPRP